MKDGGTTAMAIEGDQACVHCGLCLDYCATYRVVGSEADSPRGRLYLMRHLTGGSASVDPGVAEHVDRCLGCLACETACPSGVRFGRRLEQARPLLTGNRSAAWRALAGRMMRSHRVLRAASAAAHAADLIGLARWRRRIPWLGLLPARGAHVRGDPRANDGSAEPAGPRVFLLRGCGDALRPSIFRAAAEVLRANGYRVVASARGLCCGALSLHGGQRAEARRLASDLVAAVEESEATFVATTAAGCGAMLRDLESLFDGDPERSRAATRLAAMTRDVCELLAEAGPRPPKSRPQRPLRVAYHDACHLLHGMKVEHAPRAVLAAATGNQPVDLGDNHVCCGSAGSYNLRHHRLALEIGRAKAALVRKCSADVLAVANVGCILQLERAAALEGIDVAVRHPVEILAEAYRISGERLSSSGEA
ncbi:MAG: (Fe-S)-binding protein [Deltaproteobacteria bacterium]|nr:MAG: (Fe-S)-binding protein [Deltaproteobacteria bacterium]